MVVSGSAPALVEERDEQGKRRMSGSRHSTCGTPQGGSPTLANVGMNRFLKYWRQSGRNAAYRAHADDFVILSRGHAEEAKSWTGQVMNRLGLTLNEAKTSVGASQPAPP
jgi:RNA-directed DNA polymerase